MSVVRTSDQFLTSFMITKLSASQAGGLQCCCCSRGLSVTRYISGMSRGLSVSQAVGSLVCFSLVYRSTRLSFSLEVVLLGRQSTRLSIYRDVPSYIVRNVAISLWTASNGSPGPFVLSNCLPWAPLLSQLSYFSSDSTNGLYLNRLRYSKYNSTCYLKGTCVLISVNTSKHVKRLSFCNIYSSFGGDDDENNDSRSGTCTSTSITTIVLHQTLFFYLSRALYVTRQISTILKLL